MRLTEDLIDKALDYLQDNADAAAQARADRVYCTEYRKSLKALLMKEHDGGGKRSGTIQEREAYADPKYLAHLDALRESVFRDERLRYLMEANRAKIDAWQTKSANQRNRVPF